MPGSSPEGGCGRRWVWSPAARAGVPSAGTECTRWPSPPSLPPPANSKEGWIYMHNHPATCSGISWQVLTNFNPFYREMLRIGGSGGSRRVPYRRYRWPSEGERTCQQPPEARIGEGHGATYNRPSSASGLFCRVLPRGAHFSNRTALCALWHPDGQTCVLSRFLAFSPHMMLLLHQQCPLVSSEPCLARGNFREAVGCQRSNIEGFNTSCYAPGDRSINLH